ncbi:MAG: GDP-mannose 4,6-dehydratase [Thermodesulfobacteriota bacterium]|nr:GDP-mannose 4,6-dehydratase [Thermodesulfobacteriota bacterium]|tara:strand:+ start:5406 stop:6419 length:1014 start_codon:yes stop_codon:yes gene_type:complete
MAKALITGITGQDGAYLSKHLLDLGYEVYGAARRNSNYNTERLQILGIENDIKIKEFELLEESNIRNVIEEIQPDEIYNLGAQSFVGASFVTPMYTAEVTGLGVLRVLDAIRTVCPNSKFYQASSSEMFGKVLETPQNEETPFYPRSPYGVAKVYAHFITKNYRESYNIFGSCGILFNHESPLRGNEFVTKKIVKAVAKIKKGEQDKLILGNLDAKRDWGFAGDYVEAMHLMLQAEKPDDYVISTGETHSVREFVELSLNAVGIDFEWKGEGVKSVAISKKDGKEIVACSKEFYRPAEVDLLLGDCSKAQSELGWKPKTTFNSLVELMIDYEMNNGG